MVSIFLKCHFEVECLMTCSFSAMCVSGSFPQDKPANITHSWLIYVFLFNQVLHGFGNFGNAVVYNDSGLGA